VKPTFDIGDDLFLEVVNDCQEAQCSCPQHYHYDYGIEVRLLRGQLCKSKILNDFATCPILFESGYCEELSDDTLDILDKVRIYNIQVCMWNRRNEDDMILDFDSMGRY
jgi:hypothetical protein